MSAGLKSCACGKKLERRNVTGMCITCLWLSKNIQGGMAAFGCAAPAPAPAPEPEPVPQLVRKVHLCADDCGTRVLKEGSRCKECYVAYTRVVPRDERQQPPEVDPMSYAEAASAMLLRRQLETGQHNLVDPGRFAAACQQAGLA